MITLLLRQGGAALRMLLVATVVLGLVYPLAVWGVARLPGLHGPAEGSVVTAPDGTPGRLVADRRSTRCRPTRPPTRTSTPAPRRPREDVLGPGDPSTSGGSNQGGFSDKLLGQVEQRRAAIAAREGVAPEAVPADAVTASGSGVDPHISPAYADLQVARVARVTGLPEAQVRGLVADGHRRARAGLPRRAGGERHPAEPRHRRRRGATAGG